MVDLVSLNLFFWKATLEWWAYLLEPTPEQRRAAFVLIQGGL